MQLEDRFYTSTEVAEILGVSLRSVYRYLEDNKLNAEVKTATGRHRFTKQNIIDFLYPDGNSSRTDIYDEDKGKSVSSLQASSAVQPASQIKKEEVKHVEAVKLSQTVTTEPEEEEEPVDWLAKFREAAAKYKEEQEVAPQPQSVPQPVQEPVHQQAYQPQPTPQPAPQPVKEAGPSIMYYRSMLGGLKDIAQNLDKSARNSNLDYAFTLSAGASLHKPIKPFATLHAYVKSTDRDFFEKILRLTPSNSANAQLALVISDDSSVYSNRAEVHGLYVVSNAQLKKDIASFGDAQLAQEIADIL